MFDKQLSGGRFERQTEGLLVAGLFSTVLIPLEERVLHGKELQRSESTTGFGDDHSTVLSKPVCAANLLGITAGMMDEKVLVQRALQRLNNNNKIPLG